MHSLVSSCRQTVGKLRQVCVQLRVFSSYLTMNLTTVWVSTILYSRFIRRFNTAFSTSISYYSSLFYAYFYLFSTQPTKTTTSLLNLINS